MFIGGVESHLDYLIISLFAASYISSTAPKIKFKLTYCHTINNAEMSHKVHHST